MIKLVNNQIDPFRLEELRDHWAKTKLFKKFSHSYKVHQKGIRATNSEAFWNRLIREQIASASRNNITKQKIKIVSNYLIERNGNILDVGVGYADLEKLLKKNKSKLKVYGIDISSYAVHQANKLEIGKFKKGSISKISFGKGYFDFVCALDVLEHISPHQTFNALKEINRVLKQNGEFIVSVPLNEGLEEMVKNRLNLNAHLRTYTSDILRAELILSGFKILSEKYLFAFKKLYFLKNFVIKLLPGFRKPNLIIIVARKT